MDKSIVELRAMAQHLGVKFTFADNAARLSQLIEEKVNNKAPKSFEHEPVKEPDWRLTTRPPAKWSTRESIEDVLKGHIERGLKLSFPTPEHWRMQFAGRSDMGTVRMPLRVVVKCADRMLA